MVRFARSDYTKGRVNEYRNDMKNLHEIVNELTRVKKDNLLPKHKSSNDLAEEFADHFTSKIQKILNMLDKHPLYTPHTQSYSQQFTNFSLVTEEKFKKSNS